MSAEYGLFNDEGLVERGHYSKAAAQAAIDDDYDPEDELTVQELCPEHEDEEQARDTCEWCFAEDDDEEEEET